MPFTLSTNNRYFQIKLTLILHLIRFVATIGFHTVLTSYSTIPESSAVLFNEILLNEGDGYVELFSASDFKDNAKCPLISNQNASSDSRSEWYLKYL